MKEIAVGGFFSKKFKKTFHQEFIGILCLDSGKLWTPSHTLLTVDTIFKKTSPTLIRHRLAQVGMADVKTKSKKKKESSEKG